MLNSERLAPTNPALLLRAIKRFRDRPAFVSDEVTIRYAELGDFIGRAQVVLAAQGFQRGDCVAILGKNGTEAWLTAQAAVAMGIIVTQLHPMGSLADQLRQLEAAGARAVIVDGRGFPERGAELVQNAQLFKVLALGSDSFAPDLLHAIEAAGSHTPVDQSRSDAVGSRVFTGGTTGKPKMIEMRHRTAAAQLATVLSTFELPTTPRLLAAGPITHVTGSLLMPTLVRGGSVHMLPGFDPARVLRTIEQHRINAAMLIPVMVYTLLDHPDLDKTDLSSLELALYGGSAMAPHRLMEALTRIGQKFAQLYGQTECYPIAYLPKADHDINRPELMSACGFPVTTAVVKLLNEAGEEVAEGEAGEICVRAPHVFEGYANDAETTAQTLCNGWHHTGDIARADAEGRLFIVDRKKDMIVSGGFNVYPREVEDAIATHPGVAMSAVLGIPDDKWGEAVCAYVVVKPGSTVTEADIIATVKGLKGSVQSPKSVRFVEKLPLTPVGKVDKKPLRDAAWANAERKVN